MSPADVRAWADEVERITSRHIPPSIRQLAESAGDQAGPDGGQTDARLPVHLLFFGFPAPGGRP